MVSVVLRTTNAGLKLLLWGYSLQHDIKNCKLIYQLRGCLQFLHLQGLFRNTQVLIFHHFPLNAGRHVVTLLWGVAPWSGDIDQQTLWSRCSKPWTSKHPGATVKNLNGTCHSRTIPDDNRISVFVLLEKTWRAAFSCHKYHTSSGYPLWFGYFSGGYLVLGVAHTCDSGLPSGWYGHGGSHHPHDLHILMCRFPLYRHGHMGCKGLWAVSGSWGWGLSKKERKKMHGF